MNPCTSRTVRAFLLAPWVAPIAFGSLALVFPNLGEPRFATAGLYFVFGAIYSFALSLTLGLAIFCTLRALRWECIATYAVAGAIPGLGLGLALLSIAVEPFRPAHLVFPLIFTAVGGGVASCFACLRGPDRRNRFRSNLATS